MLCEPILFVSALLQGIAIPQYILMKTITIEKCVLKNEYLGNMQLALANIFSSDYINCNSLCWAPLPHQIFPAALICPLVIC